MVIDFESKSKQGRLIVVSNRLPVTISQNDKTWKVTLSSGGLVTALSGLKKEIPFTWVGWPGKTFEEHDIIKINELLLKNSCVPVYLDSKTADLFYNGFSNSILWPLFHYHAGDIVFDQKSWNAYTNANESFAKVVLEIANDGDLIWVHDYHLMLLCNMLQKGLARRKKNVKIGWFLHTPFPSSEIYRALPVRQEILEGVLSADLLGFHTYDYARHFLSSCTRILGLQTTTDGVEFEGRKVKVMTFPIGIDPNVFLEAQRSTQVISRLKELETEFKGKKVIVGVDRLDYIKGVPQKFMAFESLLKAYPEYIGKVVLVQVAVPSRGDVEHYQELIVSVNELVGLINGKYGTIEYTPIHFLHKSVDIYELTSLYTRSDACLITSTRDGMNLVSYEYVACQKDRHGVLLLSEFTGAAQSLNGSLIINPWNYDDIAKSLHEALSMDESRKLNNYNTLSRYVNKYTAAHWGLSFVSELQKTTSGADLVLRVPFLTPSVAVEKFNQAKSIRPILIYYDGTLCPTYDSPNFANPTKETLRKLSNLIDVENTIVYIISGRTRAQLESWFGSLDIGLIAEHGSFYRHPKKFYSFSEQENSKMSPSEDLPESQINLLGIPIKSGNGWFRLINSLKQSWHDTIIPLFEHYTERTPGSYVEKKEINITWNYRMADDEFGLFQSNEIQINLEKILAHLPISVFIGDRYLEVKPSSVTTSSILKYILGDILCEHPDLDFLLIGCGDKAGEHIFSNILKIPKYAQIEHLLTFTVGRKLTNASYYVNNHGDVLEIIESLALQ
ncbi:Alpha,alpha-trehalose-phosphate synthase [UDP-forming] A [Smittium culicis]|uniref:alpha,alpha-trehalose-phosphate synthase (UDP-forming) n=2 Tax=Smittium culicis TaxID=133412 RepID=A0A1R1YE35_9FUNG|nr:Alpha,alpha-trehalose-phosphate synthase [UDP-forming] A [Smittium culicis]